MTLKQITYRTLTGTKEVLEFPKKINAQWIVYLDNTPKFHVDCFDLKTESNVIMNSLVLCARRTIEDVLRDINKKQNIKLSVKKAPLIEIPVKTELKDLKLKPLPLKWLN